MNSMNLLQGTNRLYLGMPNIEANPSISKSGSPSAQGNPNLPNTKGQKDWHVFISAPLSGSLSALICFPFEGIKKKLQSGQPISFKSFYPRELFRGSTAFAVSVTVATTSSMLFNKLFQQIPGYDSDSAKWQAGSALGSGMLGAVVGSTPVENIILKQQLEKTTPVKAITMLFSQRITRPWTGMPSLMIREAGFGFVMLWGGRACRNAVQENTGSTTLATVAEMSVGALGAVATQPFDTIATRMQLHDGKISMTQAVKEIRNQWGWKGFFRGGGPRVGLFTGCMLFIPRIEELARKGLSQLQ